MGAAAARGGDMRGAGGELSDARTQLPEPLGQLRGTVEDGKPAVGGEKVTRA